jgi:hypothetical protein
MSIFERMGTPTETIVKYCIFMIVISVAMYIRNDMTINLFIN